MFSIIGSEKHDSVYNETKYLKSKKSSIIYVISYNHAKIKVDSYKSLQFPQFSRNSYNF